MRELASGLGLGFDKEGMGKGKERLGEGRIGQGRIGEEECRVNVYGCKCCILNE